jgi:hypothetical protein
VIGTAAARCTHCPVDPPSPCAGLEVRRLCELIDPAHAAYNPDYIPLLQKMSADSIARERSGVGDDDLESSFGVAESIALLRRMKECPHRAAADCSCSGLARCSLGRGYNALVNYLDCFTCLRAGGPSEQEPGWSRSRDGQPGVNRHEV